MGKTKSKGKGKGKGSKPYFAMAVASVVLLSGCSALSGLTAKSTAEECTAKATEAVTQACARLGDVRDKSSAFVTTVKGAADAAK
jgi:hypothetical protein